jgi:release factor glutamine methyltransferase
MNLLLCGRSNLYLKEQELNVSGIRENFLTILEKRAKRIPLAYLLKEADFWQETLYVDERCLIPRPETEILVEAVIREMKGSEHTESLRTGGEAISVFKTDRHAPLGLAMTNSFSSRKQAFSFLDIGTGSGAIAIAILRAFGNARGTLLDISGDALEVARINLEKYGLQDRATLIQDDIFNSVPSFVKGEKGGFEKSPLTPLYKRGELVGKWDLIVSNPPYLSETDWNGVQEELKFEPKKALDGGKDGLNFYRRIIAGVKNHLTPGGLLTLEVGQGQAETVSTWLHEAGYDNIHRFKDHLQVQRVVIARLNKIQ